MQTLIRLYQLTVGMVLPPSCRFHPSCSDYTIEAVARFGVAAGLLMGMFRILRCNPFMPGGFDPVPDHFTLRRTEVKDKNGS